jgi:IstB-like ATP binding protein
MTGFEPMSAAEQAEWRREAAESAAADQAAARAAHIEARRPVELAEKHPLGGWAEVWAEALAGSRVGPPDGPRRHKLNVWMAGGYGTAKTWTAWAIAIAAAYAGYRGSVLVVKAGEWQRRVEPPVDWDWIDDLSGCGLLILDDLGAGRLSAWQQDKLAIVFDARWENRRPTIITTNSGQLGAMVGDRAADRLAASILPVPFDGPSYRTGLSYDGGAG